MMCRFNEQVWFPAGTPGTVRSPVKGRPPGSDVPIPCFSARYGAFCDGKVRSMVFGDLWSAAPLPLIGRDVEAAILDAALRSASAGHGQLVVIEGEAGIGKSRLLDDGLA